jgi:hypothetical protein
MLGLKASAIFSKSARVTTSLQSGFGVEESLQTPVTVITGASGATGLASGAVGAGLGAAGAVFGAVDLGAGACPTAVDAHRSTMSQQECMVKTSPPEGFAKS